MNQNQQHWDKVYSEKAPTEVSWYEPMPEISLDLIKFCDLPREAAIIDIGGGDSFLAEFLIAQDYTDVTVLDISSKAIERAKVRMCEKGDAINWIISDINNFNSEKQYDLWHDRATFHFLTDPKQREKYIKILTETLKPGGFLILSTFSEKGPGTCSGLKTMQYKVEDLQEMFSTNFLLISSKAVDHATPSGAHQNFNYCCFKKI